MKDNILSLIEKLEKGGKPAQIGEVRNFGGKDYRKMASSDWQLVIHPEEKKLEAEQNKNKVVSLTDKLKTKIAEKKEISQSEKHLHDIKNQAVVEGKETRSGKPMFTKVEAALAHGYEAADFREVGSFFYERAQKMADNMAKLAETKQDVDPNFEKIKKVNLQYSKAFISQANRIDDRRENAKKAVRKSTVMMGHADGAEINTADFAIDSNASDKHGWWMEHIHGVMDGYQYGDIPRMITMDHGDLYLVKVEEGLYSGIFKHISQVENGVLEENAKVRIERMTIPSLIQFCLAKEWLEPIIDVSPIQSLTTALSEPMPVQLVESSMDKKLRMMELVAKLLS